MNIMKILVRSVNSFIVYTLFEFDLFQYFEQEKIEYRALKSLRQKNLLFHFRLEIDGF